MLVSDKKKGHVKRKDVGKFAFTVAENCTHIHCCKTHGSKGN